MKKRKVMTTSYLKRTAKQKEERKFKSRGCVVSPQSLLKDVGGSQ